MLFLTMYGGLYIYWYICDIYWYIYEGSRFDPDVVGEQKNTPPVVICAQIDRFPLFVFLGFPLLSG